jgi:hypothetical protein
VVEVDTVLVEVVLVVLVVMLSELRLEVDMLFVVMVV